MLAGRLPAALESSTQSFSPEMLTVLVRCVFVTA